MNRLVLWLFLFNLHIISAYSSSSCMSAHVALACQHRVGSEHSIAPIPRNTAYCGFSSSIHASHIWSQATIRFATPAWQAYRRPSEDNLRLKSDNLEIQTSLCNGVCSEGIGSHGVGSDCVGACWSRFRWCKLGRSWCAVCPDTGVQTVRHSREFTPFTTLDVTIHIQAGPKWKEYQAASSQGFSHPVMNKKRKVPKGVKSYSLDSVFGS